MNDVIVVLDANAIMQDPMCAGAIWQVLAHAPADWHLRLAVSEVAVAEAVAGYERETQRAILQLEKVAKSWGRMGAKSDVEALRDALLLRSQRYPEHLASSLSAAGTKILAPPNVSHREIVGRAVARRRPCDAEGDGYRDTLVWLTVLDLAVEDGADQVVFVTNDSDFLNDDKSALHVDLVEDLASRGAEDRVRIGALPDVLLELAERSQDDGGIQALRSELQDETVRQYVCVLAAGILETSLDARACALPRFATANVVHRVIDVHDVSYEVRGGVSADEAIASFSCEVNTEIAVMLPAAISLDEDENTRMLSQTPNETLYIITKPLVMQGIIKLGRYDRPLAGEITGMAARGDDPGRLDWRPEVLRGVKVNPMADALRSFDAGPMTYMPNLNVNPMADFWKNVNLNPMADILKNVNVNPMADFWKNVNLNPIADILKNVNVNPMADFSKNFRIGEPEIDEDKGTDPETDTGTHAGTESAGQHDPSEDPE
jgi:hypothetical protein